jgi:hypothetical protein
MSVLTPGKPFGMTTIQECMDMDWQDGALTMAGIVGGGTAVIHGVLVQRLMVRPIAALFAADGKIGATIRRIVPVLLHFSTFAWLTGAVALIAVANLGFSADTRHTTALCVAVLYAFGALGNLWGSRGRHPGWVLMAAALALIAFGIA